MTASTSKQRQPQWLVDGRDGGAPRARRHPAGLHLAPAPTPSSPFIYCIGVSLLLHGALIVPWLLHPAPVAPPKPDKLQLELIGMLSNRQQIQQTMRRAPAATVKQPPPIKATATAPSPVQVQKSQDSNPTRTVAPLDPAPKAPPQEGSAQQDLEQQTVQARATQADLIRTYVGMLSKAIQAKLVYPPDARAAGYEGSPAIRFTLTENGDILPGTLAIQRSSGYAELDENALRAAQTSAPFSKPPRRMNVVVAVSFAQDR